MFYIFNNITNKHVLGIVHAPDQEHNPIWNKLISTSLKRSEIKNHSDLSIITWNNQEIGLFEKSCQANDINYFHFGQKVLNWSNYLKFEYNIELCEKSTTNYVMGCDSHDTILIGSPVKILKLFLTKNCKLLFNGEIKFYPDLSELKTNQWKYFQKNIASSKFSYLNAGVWIGECNFAKKFFEECSKIRVYNLFNCDKYNNLNKKSIGCDQSSIHEIFLKYYPDVQINYEADIFLNIANLNIGDVFFHSKFL